MDNKVKNSKFYNYFQTLQLLSESTDDALFLVEVKEGIVHLASDKFAKRYLLPLDENNQCRFSDYAGIIYERDLAPWLQNMEEIQRGECVTHDMVYRLVDNGGNLVWISCRGKVISDDEGKPDLMIGRISDTALSCKVDSVTGLFLSSELHANLKRAIEADKKGVLMILGVDRFKNINTKYGRGYGNYVLKRLAAHLENCVDMMLPVYRMDGDCFAVNFVDYTAEQAREAYHEIQNRMKENCTFSAGAVCYPIMEVRDTNALYDYAESALDRAKQNGRNHLEFFSAEDYEKQLSTIDLTEELRNSIKDDCKGFYLVYQPQVSVDGYEVVGAEALLRFRSPYRGVVPPDQFIGILEQSGMIVQVGNWILKEAIGQCAKWRRHNPNFRMSINLSYVQLEYKDLSQTIYDLLEQENLPGDAIVLELTESMQLQDYTKYNQLFYQWGKRGIQISMDDFGTGYSSLGYLKSLAIDEVKVDRCFISHIDMSAYNYRLLANILELARSSQIRVVCEGVETAEELQTLAELAPEELQGFYFSKPLDADVFAENYIFEHGEEERWKKSKSEQIEHRDKKALDLAEYKQILDQMEDVIYVMDEETHELYYMNYVAQRLTGAGENYVGRKCYEVIEGKKQPCDGCTSTNLQYKSFTTRQYYNEYLGSRMLIKEKYIDWNGRKAHLQIGMDMSVMDLAMKEMQDALAIEDALIKALAESGTNQSDGEVICGVLQKTGEFYQADRCYIFVHSADNQSWSNICEWCDKDVESQQMMLASVPEKMIAPWMENLEQDKEVIVKDVSCYKENKPALFDILDKHGIRRLMIVPMMREGRLFGFIGLDNPKAFPYDNRFLRKITPLLTRILAGNQMLDASRDLIADMTSMLRDSEILTALQQGMWMIELDENTGAKRMYVDRSMKNILGVEKTLTPEGYYEQWYRNIDEKYTDYINHAVTEMMETGRSVEVEYLWRHPEKGEVWVRCIGVAYQHENGIWKLKGCHCMTNDIIREKYVDKL